MTVSISLHTTLLYEKLKQRRHILLNILLTFLWAESGIPESLFPLLVLPILPNTLYFILQHELLPL